VVGGVVEVAMVVMGFFPSHLVVAESALFVYCLCPHRICAHFRVCISTKERKVLDPTYCWLSIPAASHVCDMISYRFGCHCFAYH
jgi:hypothetical protein